MTNILYDFTPSVPPHHRAAHEAAQRRLAECAAERQATKERYEQTVREAFAKQRDNEN